MISFHLGIIELSEPVTKQLQPLVFIRTNLYPLQINILRPNPNY